METIRVAAVSMNSEFGKREQTLQRISDFCEQAVSTGAELVLFPELVVHGHCTPNTNELAETVPGGPSVDYLEITARKYGIWLAAGLSEMADGIVYNTQVLMGPDGYIGKQRKLHMSRDESLFYSGGSEINIFDIGKCTVGIVICYDNQFPEVARLVALRGADVILMPHAAREARWDDTPESETAARQKVFDHFSGYRMRACENACFCIYADQAGKAGYVDSIPRDHINQPHHPGGAMIIAPDGNILIHAQTERIRDEMIVGDLDAELLATWRSHPNYTLRTRRPELFGDLVDQHTG